MLRSIACALLCSIATVAIVPARAAHAEGPDSVFLEDLTWTELRDAVAAGKTIAIVPVGGVEQSGPQIALGKHDVRGRVLAERIARTLGDALVAPTVSYVPEGTIDPPTQHMKFPGTLTIPSDVFRKTVASIGASLRHAGFRTIVLLGEHGGCQGDLAAVADHLNHEWAGSPARARFIPDYYRASTSEFGALLAAHGYTNQEIGTHAGAADTSLAMAADPQLVRPGVLAAGTGLDAAHGVYGDPRRSSAALGQLGLDAIVRRTVAAIRAAAGPT